MQVGTEVSGEFDLETMVASLSTEMYFFLRDIATLVSVSANDKVPVDDTKWSYQSAEYNVSDWSLFSDFVMCVTQKGLKKKLTKFFAENDFPSSTLESVRSEGLGFDNAIKVFCLSAHYQKRPLDEFIKDYVLFCESQNFYPKSFLKNKTIVDDILKDYGRSLLSDELEKDQTPDISLQGVSVINNDVRSLKERLGFYPYRRNEIVCLADEELRIAEREIDKLLLAQPDNEELLSIKTVVLLKQKKSEEALELSSVLHSQNNSDRVIRTNHASCLSANGQNEDALNTSLETLNQHPEHPLVLCSIGRYYFSIGKYEDAIPYLLNAAKADRDMIAPYFDLIRAHYELGKFKQAKSIARRGLRKFPDDPNLLTYYKDLLYGQEIDEKYDNLLKLHDLDELPVKGDRFAELIKLRNGTLEEQGAFLPDYIEDIELDPFATEQDKVIAYSAYGQYWLNMYQVKNGGRSYAENALDCFNTVIKASPNHHYAYEMKAAAQILLGDDDDAKHNLEIVSKLVDDCQLPDFKGWQSYINVFCNLMRFHHEKSAFVFSWLLEADPTGDEGYAEYAIGSLQEMLEMADSQDQFTISDAIELLQK